MNKQSFDEYSMYTIVKTQKTIDYKDYRNCPSRNYILIFAIFKILIIL